MNLIVEEFGSPLRGEMDLHIWEDGLKASGFKPFLLKKAD